MKKNNGYKIDFENNTFTMNYTFAAAASQVGTPEYEIRKKVGADFPQLKVIVKSGRKQKTARKNKGLTYEHMKMHINAYDNAEELMEMFNLAVAQSKTSKSPYKYVCDWFKMQFPNYAEGASIEKKELKKKPLHKELSKIEKVA